MYKLCIYSDKLDEIEIRNPEIESLPACIRPKEFVDSPKYGNKLLWPKIFSLNPKIRISTILCKYSLRRALDSYEKKSENALKFVPSKKSQVLFMLAIPNDFSLSELANWLGASAAKINAIRMVVLDESLGFYSLILYFDSFVNSEDIYEVIYLLILVL